MEIALKVHRRIVGKPSLSLFFLIVGFENDKYASNMPAFIT
jgi:hypothetical protein